MATLCFPLFPWLSRGLRVNLTLSSARVATISLCWFSRLVFPRQSILLLFLFFNSPYACILYLSHFGYFWQWSGHNRIQEEILVGPTALKSTQWFFLLLFAVGNSSKWRKGINIETRNVWKDIQEIANSSYLWVRLGEGKCKKGLFCVCMVWIS